MLPGQNALTKVLKELIDREMRRHKPLRKFVVTGVNTETFTVQMRDPVRSVQYDDVQVAGLGLGHLKGVMKLPNVGDWVIALFQGGESVQPIILATVYDQASQNPDTLPLVLEDELLLINKEAGSFIDMLPDGSVQIRTVNEAGDPNEGARFLLKNDGSWKLFNKDNYGVEVDASGAMTLRAVTINSTQTPGTWP